MIYRLWIWRKVNKSKDGSTAHFTRIKSFPLISKDEVYRLEKKNSKRKITMLLIQIAPRVTQINKGCTLLWLELWPHSSKNQLQRPNPTFLDVDQGYLKLDKQAFMSEFNSHCVPHSHGLVPHLSRPLIKLLLKNRPLLTESLFNVWL